MGENTSTESDTGEEAHLQPLLVDDERSTDSPQEPTDLSLSLPPPLGEDVTVVSPRDYADNGKVLIVVIEECVPVETSSSTVLQRKKCVIAVDTSSNSSSSLFLEEGGEAIVKEKAHDLLDNKDLEISGKPRNKVLASEADLNDWHPSKDDIAGDVHFLIGAIRHWMINTAQPTLNRILRVSFSCGTGRRHPKETVQCGPLEGAPQSESGSDKKTDELKSESQAPQGHDDFGVDIISLRVLWLSLQSVWPALLMIFDATSFTALVAPGVAFWLGVIFVIKGDILKMFGWKDFAPTAFWAAFFVLTKSAGIVRVVRVSPHYSRRVIDQTHQLALAYLLLFLFSARVAVKVVRNVWGLVRVSPNLGLERTQEVFVIQLSGAADSGKRFDDGLISYQPDYIETDEEETPQEEYIQNLDQLEDLAQRGKLKGPNWILVILGVLMVWQVKFLCMLTDEGSSYAIENDIVRVRVRAKARHWENAKEIHWENAKKIHPDPQRLPKKKIQAPRIQVTRAKVMKEKGIKLCGGCKGESGICEFWSCQVYE
mmetsp:Transcript_12182/g.21715  ORF Transcript_12182/g.21715 Transcript_12182/m.21715 type:complete len:541 (-) Transcript_12182:226-1848(-)